MESIKAIRDRSWNTINILFRLVEIKLSNCLYFKIGLKLDLSMKLAEIQYEG